MDIKELIKRVDIEEDEKLNHQYVQFENLLSELRKKDLPSAIVSSINTEVETINALPNSAKELKKQLRKSQTAIVKLLEKELKLVTINHYRNTWMALGMAAFGIPLGVIFGTSLSNMGFIGIGLPIGMAIGIAVGTAMDKKAQENGQQLNLELKY